MEALLQHINMFVEELQSGELSLVLSSASLSYLNEILNVPVDSNSSHEKSNSTCDNLDLKKVINSLKCLRICPSQNNVEETAALNLSYFPSLTFLGIKRLNIEEIILDPSTLATLEEIRFHFAQRAVQEILKTIEHSDMCSSLTKLDLQFNRLETWSSELMYSMPALRHLNLSNNRLKLIDVSENSTLISLSAGFNMLESIPFINTSEVSSMKHLHLHNNLIDDSGIQNLKYLEALVELTLDNNLLGEYECLSELSELPDLKSLSLQGNPFSSAKTYRRSCVKYLHENACVNLFLLDGKKLSKEEKCAVGSVTTCPRYSQFDQSMGHSSFEILVPSSTTNLLQKATRTPKKARDALIFENAVEKAPRKKVVEPESPKVHLETKVLIENIRTKFGEENWLHLQAGSVIQNLMGFPVVSKEAETNTETRSNSSVSIFTSSHPSSTLLANASTEDLLVSDSEDFETSKNQESGEYILPDTANESDLSENNSTIIEPELSEDDIEGTNYIFTATKEPDHVDVFLIFNNLLFKEKDSINTKKVTVWQVKNLTSCSQLSSDGAFTKIQLTFSSYKSSLSERIYSMEVSEGSLLCSIIREDLESRSLSALNQVVYRCIKCSTMFSAEKSNNYNNNKYQRIVCQACGSNAVLEIEEPSPPTYRENNFVKSPSQSSIGSANSLKTVENHRRQDSDVEVISNPSLSSVEILEVLTRKKSSEERQLVTLPQLPEINVSNQGLTESSSSGSLTDSICTAYDGSRRRTIIHDENSSTLVEEEESETSLQLSYSDFSQIDHRVKLHLLTVHFKNDEVFVCVLKCYIMSSDANEKEDCQTKLIVFSTHSMYVFRITANISNDNVESWLKLEGKYNTNDVDRITVLPYQLGFHVSASQSAKNFFILLLDSKQAVQFLKYVDESSYFKCWKLRTHVAAMEMIISENIVKSLRETNETCSVFLVPVLHCFRINQGVPHLTSSNQMVAVILTESIISLKHNFCDFLLSFERTLTDSNVNMSFSTPVSNLLNMDVERRKADHIGCFFTTLMFDGEDEGHMKQVWKIGFPTVDELKDFTDLVQQSWEKQFGVQFPNISYTGD